MLSGEIALKDDHYYYYYYYTSPWRATNSEECNVVWRYRHSFLARHTSLLLKPRLSIIERGDTTRLAVVTSEPSEAVKE